MHPPRRPVVPPNPDIPTPPVELPPDDAPDELERPAATLTGVALLDTLLADARLPADIIVSTSDVDYLARHHLSDTVRFHHFLADDPQPDLHDHPWDYTTLLLTGGYREHTADGAVDHWAPTALRRIAEHAHRVELLDGPMWTLIATGPTRRRWGFHTPTGWQHWSTYPAAGHYRDRDRRPPPHRQRR